MRFPARGGLAHARGLLRQRRAGAAARRAAPAATSPRRSSSCAARPGAAAWPSWSPTSSASPPGSARCARCPARHELLAVEVLDPRELELPEVGTVVLADPETGRQREVVTTPLLCREFAAAAAAHRERVALALRRAGRGAPAAAHRPRLDRRRRPVRAHPQAGLVGRAAGERRSSPQPWWLAGLLVGGGARGRPTSCCCAAAVATRCAFTNLELLDKVAPKRPGWYRHIPAAALLVALALLTVALAGPAGRGARCRATGPPSSS